MVADCFRTRIGYTEIYVAQDLKAVADCFRTRIGYTDTARVPLDLRLRTAFGPGLVTLKTLTWQKAQSLRTAFGPGLVTLTRLPVSSHLTLRTAFGPGLVTLAALSRNERFSCGLLSDPDWLHSTSST